MMAAVAALRRPALVLVLGGLMLLTACALPPPTPPATIIPGYEFSLGANRDDIHGVLGDSLTGPRHDRFSNLTEIVYTFPFDAVTADTRLSDGTVRSEVTDHIHLFFDSRGRLVSMTTRPNRYYPSLTDMPVHRVKIAPRIRQLDGTIGAANIAR